MLTNRTHKEVNMKDTPKCFRRLVCRHNKLIQLWKERILVLQRRGN